MDRQYKVLLVDDQPLMLELAGKAFENKGYNVISAESGESALKILEEEIPDLALIDIVMPGMDGMEVLIEIKKNQRTSQLPVYMFSSNSLKDNVIRSAQQGATGFISKQGLSIKSLLEKIDSLSESLDLLNLAMSKAEDSEDETLKRISLSAPPFDMETKEEEPKKKLSPEQYQSKTERLDHAVKKCNWKQAIQPLVTTISSSSHFTLENFEAAIEDNTLLIQRMRKFAEHNDNFKKEDASINELIASLGMKEAIQFALSEVALHSLPFKHIKEGLNFGEFWIHSTAVALLCEEISQKLSDDEEETLKAYQIGLFHDIGKIIIQNTFPQEWDTLIKRADRMNERLHSLEVQLFENCHAHYSAQMMANAGIDESLTQLVEEHHRPIENISLDTQETRLQFALHLANDLAKDAKIGNSGDRWTNRSSILNQALKVGLTTRKLNGLQASVKRRIIARFTC